MTAILTSTSGMVRSCVGFTRTTTGKDHSMRIRDGVTDVTIEIAEEYRHADELVFPASVRTVDAFTFQDAPNLIRVRFEDGIGSIGVCAFARCHELRSVQLPQSLNEIGDGAFRECINLHNVIFDQATDDSDYIRFGNNSFAQSGVDAEVIHDENKLRHGYHLKRLFATVKQTEIFNRWTNGYRKECQGFADVNWGEANETCLRKLVADIVNGVAHVGQGETAMIGGAMQGQNYGAYRKIASTLSELRNANDWPYVFRVAREQRDKFFELFSERRPWVVFHRIVASLLPDYFVNVPDSDSLGVVYGWLSDRHFIRRGMDMRNEGWLELSHAVRVALSQYLTSGDIYECGTFAWSIAERYNTGERDNDERLPEYRQVVAQAMNNEEKWFVRNANRILV